MATWLWCNVVPFSAVLIANWFGTVVLQTTFSEPRNSTGFPWPAEDSVNFTATDTTFTTYTATPETMSATSAQPNSTLADGNTNSTLLPTDNITNSTLMSTDATTNETLLTEVAAGSTLIPSDATTDAGLITTDVPIKRSIGCSCDISPQFCDIGCCCDFIDCGVSDLNTVFSGCETVESYAVCIESWLMFRGNVDPSLIAVNETFFCVKSLEDNLTIQQSRPALSWLPEIQDFYSFAEHRVQSSSPAARAFYKADDVILTYYNSSSLLGVFRQPSPGAGTDSCVDWNPGRFLRSLSFSCSRSLTAQSCLTDPSLNARSYFSGISLLKAPFSQNVSLPGFTIPVVPLSEWPEPSIQNGSCLNVVSKVQHILQYTSSGTIIKVTVNVTLTDSNMDLQLLQQHNVTYQLATPSATRGPTATVGLKPGASVIARFTDRVEPLTIQGISPGGECSSSLLSRAVILFPQNYITGCAYSSFSRSCSELRSQLYQILRGTSTPTFVAMNAGTQPNWTGVITQDCFSSPPDDSCESGCLLPLSLSVQLLWAQRGLLSLPQSQILGAKFLFRCKAVQCPLTTPLTVMTEVTFSDATIYPVPPRGQPEPDWKVPFGFFSRGADEQENMPVLNCSGYTDALWLCTLWAVGFILSAVP
ncbi:tectonic-3-like [Paramormyrops kingsleyae]|uniref:tectonic-3-like n=1 Tax=Paramormyrops kingsleyae TaxID=1676925 RepID=UPI003B96CD8D